MTQLSPDYGLNVAAADEPMSQIELTLSAKNLKQRDLISASDPFCVVRMQRGSQGSFAEVGRTSTVKNEKNPQWLDKIIVNYYFEERCTLEFYVYDRDSKSEDLSKQDFVGSAICTMAEAVSSGMQGEFKLILKDRSSQSSGTLYISAEEAHATNNFVTLQFAAKKLDKKDGFLFGSSDPYLVISRLKGSSQVLVHKSEIIRKNLSPEWRPFTMSVQVLCNNDYDRPLKFQVYDYDEASEDDFIGEFTTTLRTLSLGPNSPQTVYECINPQKQAKKKSSYQNSGIVRLVTYKTETRPTFLEYLRTGTVRLSCTFAIDFTASNGNPNDPGSLHFRHPDGWNNYVIAIRGVGDVIQDYDADKQFPALGFGAKLPTGEVSFEFFLNGRTDSPFCSGIDMVIQAYYQALNTVQLYGPTNFSPVINHVAKFADVHKTTGDYFVLLIVTDGVISDFDATKAAIVRASYLPMSIIIVGVGDEDFSAMEALDSDGKLLRSKGGDGQTAARDIVQFVAFNEILRQHGISNYRNVFSQPALALKSKDSLAKAVLAELPNQVVAYMSANGVNPTRSMLGPS